jgi:SPP1 family predicted phage head-tail adaptor
MIIQAGRLNRKITFERPVKDDSFDGAGAGTWEPFKTVAAEVQEVLPSRAETLDESVSITSRPTRIRIYYRRDITADMRIDHDGRKLQIIAGPTEMGDREGLELMATEFTPDTSGS